MEKGNKLPVSVGNELSKIDMTFSIEEKLRNERVKSLYNEAYAYLIRDENRILPNKDFYAYHYQSEETLNLSNSKFTKDENNLMSGIILLNKILKINPQDYVTYASKGVAERHLKRYEKSLSYFNKSIEINPKYSRVYNQKGITYQIMEEYEKALIAFDKAIEFKPNYWQAYNQKGITYFLIDKNQKAIEYCDKSIKIKPTYAPAYLYKGRAKHDLFLYKEAISEYSKAIEIDSEYAGAYYWRACSWSICRKFELVISDCSKVIELEPKIYNAYKLRGRAKFSHTMCQYESAIIDFDTAIKLGDNSLRTLRLRASSKMKLMLIDEGFADYIQLAENILKGAKKYNTDECTKRYRGNMIYFKNILEEFPDNPIPQKTLESLREFGKKIGVRV